MMGFRFIENFNHPYISRSITEFWRRWHISLSSWLKDYLYIPLGGNRQGKARTYLNLFITMLLGGAWHGANWTFVFWGAWHGALLSIERALGLREVNWPRVMMFPTLLAVIIGWVMFRADNIGQAFSFYEGMIGLNGFGVSDAMSWQIKYQNLVFLIIGWALIFVHPKFLEFRTPIKEHAAWKTNGYKKPVVFGGAIVLFVLAVTKLSAESYSPFLYFQF